MIVSTERGRKKNESTLVWLPWPSHPIPNDQPSSRSHTKDNKKPNQSSHSYWGAGAPETSILQMRRNSERKTKKQGERGEDEPSVCPGSAQTLMSHWIHLCSFVGAKYNSMGLLTFQYFSLTSSREKEPFKTCEGKWMLSYWRKACLTVYKYRSFSLCDVTTLDLSIYGLKAMQNWQAWWSLVEIGVTKDYRNTKTSYKNTKKSMRHCSGR